MSKSDAWMPLHIGDYLSDTMRLTTVQHGAYLLLLMQYWKSGPLVDDDDELAGIARMDAKAWAKIGPAIRRFFVIGDDGLLHQKRADEERAKAASISAARRSAVAQRSDRKTAKPAQSTNEDPTSGGSNAPQDDNNGVTNVTDLNVRLNTHAGAELQPPLPEEVRAEAIASDADASPAPVDARETLWADGLPILQRLTGKPPPQCRSLLGRVLRDLRDDCPRALTVLREAEQARPADPVAWITRATAPALAVTARPATNGATQLRREAEARGEFLAEIPW